MGEGRRPPTFSVRPNLPSHVGLPTPSHSASGVRAAYGPEWPPMSPASDLTQAFRQRAEELLRTMLLRLDSFDPDELEAEASEGVVKLTFADGSKCVLNRQSAANQMWLAEGATAWHFEWSDSQNGWIDTKGRGDLRDVLAGVISRRLGRAFALR